MLGAPVSDDASVTAQSEGPEAAAAEAAAVEATQLVKKRVMLLEYGNSAVEVGRRTVFKTFLRVVRGGESAAIRRVTFNINPGYDRPTASLDRPNDKVAGYDAFCFEYSMGRPFPCHIAADFAPASGLAPLTIEYRVVPPDAMPPQVGRTERAIFYRRLAIVLPIAASGLRGRKRPVVVNAEDGPASSAWVLTSGTVVPASMVGLAGTTLS